MKDIVGTGLSLGIVKMGGPGLDWYGGSGEVLQQPADPGLGAPQDVRYGHQAALRWPSCQTELSSWKMLQNATQKTDLVRCVICLPENIADSLLLVGCSGPVSPWHGGLGVQIFLGAAVHLGVPVGNGGLGGVCAG